MLIKVYVNDDYEVISEKQYQERLSKKIAGLDRSEQCDLFDAWLDSLSYDKTYQAYDLLTANAEKRGDILVEFGEWRKTTIADGLADEWSERVIEV